MDGVPGGNKKPEAADIHIGRRVQERRKQMGVSQERLGEQLGITFQQIQKYEKGANRIGAGRLLNIADILSTPVGFFYDGFDRSDSDNGGLGEGEEQPDLDGSPAAETQRLLRDFTRIPDPAVRNSVLELVKTLASDVAGKAGSRERR